MKVPLTFLFSLAVLSGIAQPFRAKDAHTRASADAPASFSAGTRYAIIVGVSNYKDTAHIKSLQYAHTDAQNFRALIDSGYLGDFKPENIKCFIQKKATWHNFFSLFGWLDSLTRTVKKGDELFIYFSGHGAVSAQLQRLICQDAYIQDPNLAVIQSAITLSFIKGAISTFVQPEIGAKVFLIVDACRKPFGNTTQGYDPDQTDQHQVGSGETMLYACSPQQSSYETPYLKSGVFSYFLLQGLKGAAASKGRNFVTMGELWAYLDSKVAPYALKVLHQQQNPHIFSSPPDFVISKVPANVVTQTKQRDQILQANFLSGSGTQTPATDVAARSLTDKPAGAAAMPFSPRDPGVDLPQLPPAAVADSDENPLATILYRKITQSIVSKHLVAPKDSCAMDFFDLLKAKFPTSKYIDQTSQRLLEALVEDAQNFLDAYIRGDFIDGGKKPIDIAYEEFQRSLTVLRDSNWLKGDFTPKMLFLKYLGEAYSANPQEWKKALSELDSRYDSILSRPLVYFLRGLLYQNSGKYYSAIQCFDTTKTYISNWPYALFNQARSYYEVQEYGKSVQICRDMIKLNPNYPAAYPMLALNYENIKLLDSAIYWNKQALKIDPALTSPYFYLGRIYYILGIKNKELDDSSNMYLNQGAFNYSSPECFTYLGLKQQLYARFDSSEYYFRRALTENRFYVNAIADLATLYNFRGNSTGADSIYQVALSEQGENTKLYLRYMNFLSSKRSDSNAAVYFNKILKFNDEDPAVYLEYSKELEQAGYLEKARDILLQAAARLGASESIYYGLAQFYFTHHKELTTYDALDSAQKYLKLMSDSYASSSLANFGLYQIFLARNETDSASAHLLLSQHENKYIRLTENFNKDLLNYANLKFRQKNYDSAIIYYKSALGLSEPNLEIESQIAQAYYLTGNLDSALTYCRIAQSLCNTQNDVVRLVGLEGLIEFDYGKYSPAKTLFDNLSKMYNDTTHYIEQATCDYVLKQTSDAFALARLMFLTDSNCFRMAIETEGAMYSSNFVLSLRKLANAFNDNLKAGSGRLVAGAYSSQDSVLAKITKLFDPIPSNVSLDSLLAYEYGQNLRESIAYQNLDTAIECSKKDVRYIWRYLTESKSKNTLQQYFQGDFQTIGATKESYIIYFFRNNKLVCTELRFFYRNASTYNKVLDLLGIDRSDPSPKYFYSNKTKFASVHYIPKTSMVTISFGDEEESRSCSVNWR